MKDKTTNHSCMSSKEKNEDPLNIQNTQAYDIFSFLNEYLNN